MLGVIRLRVLGQEGNLLTVDEVPTDLSIGDLMQAEEDGIVLRVIYIDREELELGVELVRR